MFQMTSSHGFRAQPQTDWTSNTKTWISCPTSATPAQQQAAHPPSPLSWLGRLWQWPCVAWLPSAQPTRIPYRLDNLFIQPALEARLSKQSSYRPKLEKLWSSKFRTSLWCKWGSLACLTSTNFRPQLVVITANETILSLNKLIGCLRDLDCHIIDHFDPPQPGAWAQKYLACLDFGIFYGSKKIQTPHFSFRVFRADKTCPCSV